MTLVLELAPEIEARLQVLAAQQGAPLEFVAAQMLADGVLSEEERDALEDAHDLAEIRARSFEGPPVLWAEVKAEIEADLRASEEQAA